MRRGRAGWGLFWGLLLIAAGCGVRQAGEAADEVWPAADAPITVVVRNNNWSDIVVYALHSGGRVRLGSVTSMTTERFTLPRTLDLMTHPLRLQADPIGARWVYTSEGITPLPGQLIEWRLENNIQLSSLSVR